MRADLRDADKALAYARYSAEIEDFEAAISTLERALAATAPDSVAAQGLRLELAALYFRIGSYAAASGYLLQLEQGPALSSPSQARVADLRDEIGRRTDRHSLRGFVDLGVIATDNANLGSGLDSFSPFGVTRPLGDQVSAKSDMGLRARAALRHSYDLGLPNANAWETELSGVAQNYFEQTESSSQAIALRTGPSLGLDDMRYGPKIRPYVGGSIIWQGGDLGQFEAVGGARLSQALSDEWFAALELEGGRRWVEIGSRADERDADLAEAAFELAYTPTRRAVIRARIAGVAEEAETDAFGFIGASAKVSGRLGYDAGFSGVNRLWSISAYAEAIWRDYDAADPATDPGTREDRGLRFGVSHSAFISQRWSVEIDLRHELRRSSVDLYEFEATRGGIAMRYTF